MSFGSSRTWRTLIVVFFILLVVFEMIAYVATTPRPHEQFFQLYVLGANRMASDYYPNNNPEIVVGELVTWYLGVSNVMGTVQLASIRVKASNQTIAPPDDQQGLESPAPAVTDFARYLRDNETWETPFIWTISNASTSDGVTRILLLQINNETYQIPEWSANNGHNFRLIFELWTWQIESNEFEFGWTTNGEHRIAWLQIWFNMTTRTPPR